MRILLIEDDRVTGRALSELLRGRGHSVEWAVNGESGLVKLDVFLADAVVLDWCLPDVPGSEFLRRVREDARTAALPVIVASAVAGEDLERVEAVARADPLVRILRKAYTEEALENLLVEVTVNGRQDPGVVPLPAPLSPADKLIEGAERLIEGAEKLVQGAEDLNKLKADAGETGKG